MYKVLMIRKIIILKSIIKDNSIKRICTYIETVSYIQFKI